MSRVSGMEWLRKANEMQYGNFMSLIHACDLIVLTDSQAYQLLGHGSSNGHRSAFPHHPCSKQSSVGVPASPFYSSPSPFGAVSCGCSYVALENADWSVTARARTVISTASGLPFPLSREGRHFVLEKVAEEKLPTSARALQPLLHRDCFPTPAPPPLFLTGFSSPRSLGFLH